MAEGDITQRSKTKRAREPPSVPFLWEMKPGVPIKDWKPSLSPVAPVLPPPVKLIASVPFHWEEKPGKPLPEFTHEHDEPKLLCLPPPAMHSHGDEKSVVSRYDFSAEIRHDEHGMCDLDLESFGFETDDSFSSAPSLLANCLASSAAISRAVAVDSVDSYPSENLGSSSSADSDTDSTGSYATGASSLVGASFLEHLFPHIPPESGFLEKVPQSEEVSQSLQEVKSKVFDDERNTGITVQKPWTLEELILMSRRRSCQQKAASEMKMQNLSMDFSKNGAFACCLLEPSIKLIEGLQWKKFQPRLKLV